MSGELILRPSRGGLIKPTQSEARQKLELSLQRVRGGQLAPQPLPRPLAAPTPSALVIDLPRICAVHDRPYAARYIARPGEPYRFGQTIRLNETLTDQYRDPSRGIQRIDRIVKSGEVCPWCGSGGFGPVLCGDCHAEVCYGRTDAREYFVCRDSCGGHGKLVSDARARDVFGVRPGLAMPTTFSSSR